METLCWGLPPSDQVCQNLDSLPQQRIGAASRPPGLLQPCSQAELPAGTPRQLCSLT
jgi:hypothetical protein